MNEKIVFMCKAALIAALYVLLTYISFTLGLSSGAVQLRLSEMLCILPYFTAAAVPGLTVGCLAANIITGCALWDVILGSAATLVGAFFARKLKSRKWLVPLPCIISNTLVIPIILVIVYGSKAAYPFLLASVFLGETASIYGIGMPLLLAIEKRKITL